MATSSSSSLYSQSSSHLSLADSAVSTPATEVSTLFSKISNSQLLPANHNDNYILISGGLGYIGSHTTWELLKEGHNVIVIDNLDNSYRGVLESLQALLKTRSRTRGPQPSLQFYEADYRDLPTLRLILNKYATSRSHIEHLPQSRITGVIHFAAYKAVVESIKQPLKYYANNVGGLVTFCSLLGEFGIKKFIFSSSATVYGDSHPTGDNIKEETCTHERTTYVDGDGGIHTRAGGCTGLTNPYGRSKWMCEAILNDLAFADPDWTIFALRYFNPIGCDVSAKLGESPRGIPNNLMPIVVKVISGEAPFLNIFGSDWDTQDGTAIRDYIHVTDLARGHVAALRSTTRASSENNFHVLNLGTGGGHSVLEVVAAMESVTGRKVPLRIMGRREGDVGKCVADASRAQRELSWKAELSLEDACRDIWRFLKSEPGMIEGTFA